MGILAVLEPTALQQAGQVTELTLVVESVLVEILIIAAAMVRVAGTAIAAMAVALVALGVAQEGIAGRRMVMAMPVSTAAVEEDLLVGQEARQTAVQAAQAWS